MAINVEKAFDSGEGFVITNDDGNILCFITAGVGSPVGLSAPLSTLYIDDSSQFWRKFGLNNDDWAKLEFDRNFSYTCIDQDITIKEKQLMMTPVISVEPEGCLDVEGRLHIIGEG